MNRLKDKVALITGSGAGIGRATAILFSNEGAKVVVASLGRPRGLETVRMITDNGGEAIYIRTDVTKAEDVRKALQEGIDKFGKLDILDINAGGSVPEDLPIDRGNPEIWEKVLNFNLVSAFLCCRYGIPELIKNGGGSVILTGSTAGLKGWKRPAYSAAKGGIIALTRCLALDYARHNIRVNCVCPGQVLSERVKKIYEGDPGFFQDVRPLNLLGFGEPMDTAYAKLYVASDEAKRVTGAIFSIDSGYTAVGRIDENDLLKKL